MRHNLNLALHLRYVLIAACAVASLGWAAAPVFQAPYDEEFPRKNAWARITPSVTWCGDASSAVTIEVHIIARDDVTEVEVTNHDEDDRISLYDDGTHGDAASGDRIFTREDVVLACRPASLKYGRAVGTWHGMLRVKLSNGRTAGNNFGFAAGLVNPIYRGTFAAQDFGDGLSATAYAFFIADSGHEVLPSYPVAPVTCGKTNFEAYRKLYSVLPDAFDLVVLTPGLQLFRPDGFGENVPYQVAVSNAVEHIGLPIMDKSAAFGSAGRLTSAVYTSFGTIQIVDHELAHTWGAALGRRSRADRGRQRRLPLERDERRRRAARRLLLRREWPDRPLHRQRRRHLAPDLEQGSRPLLAARAVRHGADPAGRSATDARSDRARPQAAPVTSQPPPFAR